MTSGNKIVVPEAKNAMEQFKMQAANEVGVPMKQGYNGDLTSRQAGSIGGQMVKNVAPTRTKTFVRSARTREGHTRTITYIVDFTA